MNRWRVLLVVVLLVFPVLFWCGVGSYHLWLSGWGFIVWWPLALCMGLGYTLGWYWQRKRLLLHPPDFSPAEHWTEQDRQAWLLVEKRAIASPLTAQLTSFDHYWTTAKEMAQELAAIYRPGSEEPIDNLTVPEILTVIELASRDLCELVDQYVPGSHLLTIGDWRRARKALDWYAPVSNVYWAITALFSPLETGARFAASKLGLSQPWQQLQQNLILWFYSAYVHRLGTYLIELNSGRLRVGATRYRQLLDRAKSGGVEPSSEAKEVTSDTPECVTIALFGQVKAGKSSLVNAMLGERRAVTDVLPATAEVERYHLRSEGIASQLQLLDTVGYGHEGPKADRLAETLEAVQNADLLLLVLHARNPARAADVQLLQEIRAWFTARPQLKRPPILAVLTHIDLLSPALEWSPPYDWRKPVRSKEQNVHEALHFAWKQIGEDVSEAIPVCTVPGKIYGVEEWLMPAVTERLSQAKGVALLRCLRKEIDDDKIRKIWRQMLATAKEASMLFFQLFPREGSKR